VQSRKDERNARDEANTSLKLTEKKKVLQPHKILADVSTAKSDVYNRVAVSKWWRGYALCARHEDGAVDRNAPSKPHGVVAEGEERVVVGREGKAIVLVLRTNSSVPRSEHRVSVEV
jgi:hypothetical protein